MNSKILDKNNIDIVLYHGSCFDGYGSAFVVWNYYKNTFGLTQANEIKYYPCYYQKDSLLTEEYIKNLAGKNILMCDFSYKYDQLMQIINVANSFMILDHHKTAEADLQEIDSNLKIFDMKRSGCGITWDFFNQYTCVLLPKFLEHIQDRDLWTFKLEGTNEFVAFFYEQGFNFEEWEKYLDNNMVDKAIEKGKSWLEYQKIVIDSFLRRSVYIIHEMNEKYYIALYCNSPIFKSDLGNKLFGKYSMGDFSCVWDYDTNKDQTIYSLRSTDERSDVSIIAKVFGGGGHRNASGLSFKGMVGCLPLPRIDDPNILSLLLHCEKDVVEILDNEYDYSLFKVKEIKEEWLSEKYFDLLKRKCKDTILLVFEEDSDQVNVINNSEVVLLKKYTIFYNEQSIKKPEKLLQFMVCADKDYALTFNSSETFKNSLKRTTFKPTDELSWDSMSESDSEN